MQAQLPALPRVRSNYATASSVPYTGVSYLMVQLAPTGNYPRGEAILRKTNPGYYRTVGPTLDQARVKSTFGFFKSREFQTETKVNSDVSSGQLVYRFAVENTNCVAFDVIVPGNEYMQNGARVTSVTLFGYYCGPPQAPLTDSDIQWVLWGHRITLPPANNTVRLAAQPSMPLSAALRVDQAATPSPPGR